MKTIEILGENRFEVQTKTRVACRGIVLSDEMKRGAYLREYEALLELQDVLKAER